MKVHLVPHQHFDLLRRRNCPKIWSLPESTAKVFCGSMNTPDAKPYGRRGIFIVWNWRNDGFLLSYEREPDHGEFEPGEVIPLDYRISLEAFGRKGEAV